MHVKLPKFDLGENLWGNAQGLSEAVLRSRVTGQRLSYFAHPIRRELLRFLSIKPVSERMKHVFSSCHPFEIIRSVVMRISVFVINFRLVFGVGVKRTGDSAMNPRPNSPNGYQWPSVSTYNLFKDFWFRGAGFYPKKRSYSTEAGRFDHSILARYRQPNLNFHPVTV